MSLTNTIETDKEGRQWTETRQYAKCGLKRQEKNTSSDLNSEDFYQTIIGIIERTENRPRQEIKRIVSDKRNNFNGRQN